jgi:hypothetical protein
MKRAVAGITITVLAALVGLVPRGAVGQCCGDCNGDGAVTIDEILTTVNHALTSCSDDGICSHVGGQRFPASGQTTAYGSGSDGDERAGAVLSYTDNGDGTITDANTGLMWEKKDDSGGIHDKDNTYTWGTTSEPYTMDGTMVTEFLATLNTEPCFAGHCDWRIPNVKELQSLVDYEVASPGPTVNPAFDNAAGCPGCTDVTLASCSCTASYPAWSSTTTRGYPASAWDVTFGYGYVSTNLKNIGYVVRAVRGGCNALNGCGTTPEEQGCVASGGTVTTALCCATAPDFPDTCDVGACGCLPESSHDVRFCECAAGACFDRTQRACISP